MGGLPSDVQQQWVWPQGVAFTASSDGLINQTWLAWQQDSLIGVIQRLNTDIFVPQVHEDIQAVTEHVAHKGLLTPRIVPTRDGALWAASEHGVFRRLSPVGQTTLHKLASAEQARSAGAMVGRFHTALLDFEWSFRSVRTGAHDTPQHMERLAAAVRAHPDHRLSHDVQPLAADIDAFWSNWTGSLDQPLRVIHGDLKVSNLRWQDGQAAAIIDLDTMQWGSLAVELGDAFRSWCNPTVESDVQACFDVPLFIAAMQGYLANATPSADELCNIVPGIERIAVELAARFARDALEESYFGFDPAFGSRGEHNLLRAQGQLALARSVRQQADAAQRALRELTSRV